MKSLVRATLRTFAGPCNRRPGRGLQRLAALVLALLAVGAIGSALATESRAEEDFERLRQMAAERGRAPVIVHLDLQMQPESLLERSQVEEQRNRLKASQDRVLDSLIARRLDPTHALKLFRFVPILALHADLAQLEHLKQHPEVVHISEDKLGKPQLDDSTGLIGAPTAWAGEYIATGYAVAILDSGVGPHPFFPPGKIVAEACYSTSDGGAVQSLCPGGVGSSTDAGSGADCAPSVAAGCSHGTHVAGIAAGVNGASSEGIINGVAHDADIIAINIFSRVTGSGCGTDSNGDPEPSPCIRTWESDQLRALERVQILSAEHAIAAVNMSIGGQAFAVTCDVATPNIAATKLLIDELAARRIATVISAGNDSLVGATGQPGCISSAITVGSTTKNDRLSGFSNIASWVDLLAPGTNICSSVIGSGSGCGSGYARYSGTSMAAPQVAGAWAVMRSRNHMASVTYIRDRLRFNGLPISTPAGTFSRISLDLAVNAMTPDIPLTTDEAVPHLAWNTSANPKFRYFHIDVLPGSPLLHARIQGSVGDADLYVRYNAKPTATEYDCRPFLDGSSETCAFPAPAAGRWWIGIRPFTDYRRLELLATYTRSENSVLVTSSGEASVPIQRFSGPTGTGGITNYTYTGLTGTVIELEAPLSGPSGLTLFSRWEGCDSVYGNGLRICVVNFNGNREINAVYAPISVNLRVRSGGINGVEITGTPAVASGITQYDRSFGRFANVSLVAPAQVYAATFTGWSGCDSTSGDGGRTCNVSMNQARTVDANYSNQSFNLSVGSTGANAVPIDGGFYSGTTNFNLVRPSGSFHEFTAPASASGLGFAGWSGCDPPAGGGIGPTATALSPPPITCDLIVDGHRSPTAHYGSYPGTTGFTGDFADQHWTRSTTNYGCGAASIIAASGSVTLKTASGCALSIATYTHRGAMVDGWISFDWSHSESESHTWIAQAGILGKPMTTLAQGGNGGGGVSLMPIKPGERLVFDLRKTDGFGTTDLIISNFSFQPVPTSFYTPIYSSGFEPADAE